MGAGEHGVVRFGWPVLAHGDVGHGPALVHEGQERGAAVGRVGRDALGPTADPLGRAHRHDAARVHLGREAGGAGLRIHQDAARHVDQDVERMAEPPMGGAL